jgi:acid stress-induced BolA-like protein IbaG/YrbA
MRRQRLESLLTARLKLKSPRFKIQKVDNRLCGHVISDTFKGMGDHKRQQLILDALEEELGLDAAREVGMLLAYTNDEWNVELPAKAG